jgi:hypothetical protein
MNKREKQKRLRAILVQMDTLATPAPAEPVNAMGARAARVRLCVYDARPLGDESERRARDHADECVDDLRRMIRAAIGRELRR